MQVLFCNAAALVVAALFYTWRAHTDQQSRRERKLRERVTYMLWMMANQVA